MIKKILFSLLALFAAAAFAAVDANKADQAALETVKGIGPAISGKIIEERKKSPFKDWADMVERVKGVGEGSAAKFSDAGLTVNGASFKGASAKPDDKKSEKKADKEDAKKSDKAASAADAKASAPKPADAKASAAAAKK